MRIHETLAFACIAVIGLACDAERSLAPDPSLARSSQSQGAPSNLALITIASSQIDLSWQDNSSDERAFEVHRAIAGPAGAFVSLARTGASVNRYSDVGITPTVGHCYKVRAVGVVGRKESYSAFSNTACAATPAAPTGLVGTTLDGSRIALGWADNATTEQGYDVERCTGAECTSFIQIGRTAPQATSWMDAGLSLGTTYRYQVRARNGVGVSEYSNVATVSTSPASTLEVMTRTIGPDPDPDGYVITISKKCCDGFTRRSMVASANGTLVVPDLAPGSYGVELEGDAPNCHPTSPPILSIQLAGSAAVRFDLACDRSVPIAYSADVDGNHDVHSLGSDGMGDPVRLTSDPGSDTEPAVSADGGRIAFVSDRDGDADLYVMNADGTNVVRLTNDPGAEWSPAWSPDGRRIAFASEDGIRLVSADGTGETVVTNAHGRQPTWSPDGQRIAFVGVGLAIYSMRPDGSELMQISFPVPPSDGRWFEYDTHPAWSPDGTRILYARTQCDGMGDGCMHQLQLVRPNGEGLEAPTGWYGSMGTSEGEPTWSPDGKKIVFVAGDLIMVLPLDGRRAVELARGASPAWGR